MEVRMKADTVIRRELLALLRGGNAHMSFDEAVEDFPLDALNTRVPHSTYRVWHVLWHMRIVQWDILEFIRNPAHVSPDFPAGLWPGSGEEAAPEAWEELLKEFRRDRKALEDMVSDPETDFFSPIPHAPDYTIFREILLAADHNVFHTSELISIRRILDLNPVKEY
jgi:hypothetical protein